MTKPLLFNELPMPDVLNELESKSFVNVLLLMIRTLDDKFELFGDDVDNGMAMLDDF